MSEARGPRGPVGEALHEVPLRLRLVAVTVGLLVAALSFAGLAASYLLENYVLQQKSDELHKVAPDVLAQLRAGMTEVPARTTTRRYNVYSVTIQVSGSTEPGAASTGPAIPSLTNSNPYVSSNTSFVVPSQDGTSRWIVAAYAGPTPTTTIAIALPLDSADDVVSRMRWSTIIISLVAAGVTALLGWFLIRRAFRPLTQIEDTAKAIADGDLARRVPPSAARDEVASLSRSLNAMLSRIEQSFAVRTASEDRMRRFVADASHELRTPLATMRGYAELYRQGAVTEPDDIGAAMRRIEHEAVRMSALVDDLLLLTRLDQSDADSLERPHSTLDLTVLAAEAVQDAQARDRQRPMRLVGWDQAVQPTEILGDEAQLRQVLTNLLTNAVRYTPSGTAIEVLVGEDDSGPLLAVRDHGPGIPAEQRHRVFERFYRGEVSRNTELGGSGLGLAIVQAIVTAHFGDVSLEETPGGGATFVVRFPQPAHRLGQADGQPGEID